VGGDLVFQVRGHQFLFKPPPTAGLRLSVAAGRPVCGGPSAAARRRLLILGCFDLSARRADFNWLQVDFSTTV
jgi:hypothetical protein